ncbi:DEAD/DEAH box helicase family protein [bacterium]|nr:DEAD/DEAH box helicase family protein [bacterium]
MPPPIEGPASHYITREARELIAGEIAEAGGVEVFFIGRRGSDGLVQEVESHAYGSADAVPALIDRVRPGEVILHNHPSGNLLPSDADLSISSQMGSLGAGSYVIDNAAERVRVIVRPHDPKKKTPLDIAEIERSLGPNSAMAKELEHYEDRPMQRDMAGAVAEALNNDGIAVIEAGTGTGKSLAYLVPTVQYALLNQERVVISTNTINLQEQILHKDLPAVRHALDREFRAELVKGRGNYVCKRKAEFAAEEINSGQAQLFVDERVDELRELLNWASASETGDVGELAVSPSFDVWERVVSEVDNCLRVRCKFYEQCFFYNSRRRAARANILVVNHSLLMSDLAVRRETGNWSTAAVLPPYTRVVLDEAHHVEEVATRHLGRQITRAGLARITGRIYRRDSRRSYGSLAAAADQMEKLRSSGKVGVECPALQAIQVAAVNATEDMRQSVDFLLEDIGQRFLDITGLPRPRRRSLEHRKRLVPDILQNPRWADEIEPLIIDASNEIAAAVEANKAALKEIEELPEDVQESLLNHVMEWRAHVGRLDEQRRMLRKFLEDDPIICRWIELAADARDRLIVRLCHAPISVAKALKETLHHNMKTEVLTSATLTVDNEFNYLMDRIGLSGELTAAFEPSVEDDEPDWENDPVMEESEIDPEEPSIEELPAARPLDTRQLQTPFVYRDQVFFGVPNDLGDPRRPGYEDRLDDLIVQAVSVSGGRGFVLFTSHGHMRRAHAKCAPTIQRLGIDCLIQGQESRDRLLRRFREDHSSVLFATSSFWEGVDVRGRALELLIIARLPFSVPDEPVHEAQFEHLRNLGLDPFQNLVVPRAIIRLKQGFGRLIRSRTDRGAVLVADDRVTRMYYGRRFIRSLPEMEIQTAPSGELVRRMSDFYRGIGD